MELPKIVKDSLKIRAEYLVWSRVNGMLKSWIYNSASESMRSHVLKEFSSSRTMDLKSMLQ